MAKKVLVINSSPRAKGNTDALAAALARGAESAGNSARQVNLRALDIRPCIGCYQCTMKKGDPCVQKDGMGEIYAAIDWANVVVFASPLYWWQFNAQMKAVIDRLFAVAAAAGMQMPPKEVALLIAAEDAREDNFAQIIPYYQTCLVQNLRWTDRGMVLAGGVNMPGDVEKTPYLEKAEALGASL
ncbi:flavodoxin family protein [Ruminococcaceae bacterium OttesenSCG-928-D13]|nr:flavodoxin family protein [Ruminococcaceae bacterium OttesenSCG-928-D13]